jgi:hypothetical protein
MVSMQPDYNNQLTALTVITLSGVIATVLKLMGFNPTAGAETIHNLDKSCKFKQEKNKMLFMYVLKFCK